MRQTMVDEMTDLHANVTLDSVPLSLDNTMSYCWIYTIKVGSDDYVGCLKDYTQIYGLVYRDVCSLIPR